MKTKFTCVIGILGVSLFIVSSFVGGFLIEDYSLLNQYISETYAIDTEYGVILRTFGHIPSGILIAVFCVLGSTYFQASKLSKIGFFGLAIFYGLATVIVGIFPCDSGCNKQLIDPSIAQVIHNLTGLLTYICVPICMLLIGMGLKKLPNYNRFSLLSITYAILSMLSIYVVFSNSNSNYIGLYQRMVEAVFIIWIMTCAITIKNKKPAGNKGYK